MMRAGVGGFQGACRGRSHDSDGAGSESTGACTGANRRAGGSVGRSCRSARRSGTLKELVSILF
jgi:hypothetical protein